MPLLQSNPTLTEKVRLVFLRFPASLPAHHVGSQQARAGFGLTVHAHRPAPSKAGPSSSPSRVLTFTSHAHFRHRLVMSILSRRPIRIDAIRPDDDQPGLHAYEVSFLRLLEKMTEGTRVEISYTGTSVLFHPGTLAGGTFTHQCPLDRSVGWYLEPLLGLAPFGKKDLVLTLKGITTDGRDASVDTIRTAGLPHLAMFLDKEGLELKVRPTDLGDGFPSATALTELVADHKTRSPATWRWRDDFHLPFSASYQERL